MRRRNYVCVCGGGGGGKGEREGIFKDAKGRREVDIEKH